jgi:hypothetical protein
MRKPNLQSQLSPYKNLNDITLIYNNNSIPNENYSEVFYLTLHDYILSKPFKMINK